MIFLYIVEFDSWVKNRGVEPVCMILPLIPILQVMGNQTRLPFVLNCALHLINYHYYYRFDIWIRFITIIIETLNKLVYTDILKKFRFTKVLHNKISSFQYIDILYCRLHLQYISQLYRLELKKTFDID